MYGGMKLQNQTKNYGADKRQWYEISKKKKKKKEKKKNPMANETIKLASNNVFLQYTVT